MTIFTPHRPLAIWARGVFQAIVGRCQYLGLTAILTIMAACSPSIAETFPPQNDFCAEIGRALTDRERLEKALVYAYADASLYHFQQFKSRLPAAETEVGERAVVDKYLDTFVDSCAVLPPAYLQEEWASLVVQFEAENGSLKDWNRDVKIARRTEDWGRFDQLKGTLHWHKRMDACGNIKMIDRG